MHSLFLGCKISIFNLNTREYGTAVPCYRSITNILHLLQVLQGTEIAYACNCLVRMKNCCLKRNVLQCIAFSFTLNEIFQ
jgi:hypothetical protein